MTREKFLFVNTENFVISLRVLKLAWAYTFSFYGRSGQVKFVNVVSRLIGQIFNECVSRSTRLPFKVNKILLFVFCKKWLF